MLSGGRAVALLVLVVVGACLAACGGTSGAAGTLTLYNGQHPQTTQTLVDAFEHATGIAVQVRSADENTLAQQVVAEGANSPADVVLTENSPSLEFLSMHGALAPVDPATLATVPPTRPLAAWRLGRRVGACECDGVQPARARRHPTADVGDAAGSAAVRRQAGPRTFGDRLPTHRRLGRAHVRRGGRRSVVGGVEGECVGPHLPGQRDGHHAVNSGQAAIGIINQYYWYRERAQVGAAGMHSPSRSSLPTTSGTWSTCRERPCSDRARTSPRRSGSSAS